MGAQKLTYYHSLEPLWRNPSVFFKALEENKPKSEKRLNYFTGGMLLPNRNDPGSNDYRYGFQNQEIDSEIKGDGNSSNFKYRMYDPRIVRFFAVDPLTSKYPHYTPYSFSGNKLIAYVELEGLEEMHYTGNLARLGLDGSGTLDLSLPQYSFVKAQIEKQVGFTLKESDVLVVSARATGDSRGSMTTVNLNINATVKIGITQNKTKVTKGKIGSSITLGLQAGAEAKLNAFGLGINANAANLEIVGESWSQSGSDEAPIEYEQNTIFNGETKTSSSLSLTLGVATVGVGAESDIDLTESGVTNTKYKTEYGLGPILWSTTTQEIESTSHLSGSQEVTPYEAGPINWEITTTTGNITTDFTGTQCSFSVACIVGFEIKGEYGVETTTETTVTVTVPDD